jgi:aromatic-L-amino-acid/L-tryptophan decarboxylase
MWLHVDAAWAGVTLACPEHREMAQLPGINEYADSLCINFHKVAVWG